MFDTHAYFQFIKSNASMISLVSNILIILLIIITLSTGLTGGAYAALIIAVLVGVMSLGVTYLAKSDAYSSVYIHKSE